jgi:hypothetical protein
LLAGLLGGVVVGLVVVVVVVFGLPHPHPFVTVFIFFLTFLVWCYLLINTCISKKFVVPLHMFTRKYTVSVLDSKWNVIKNRLKLDAIPRKDELLFFDNLYYEVMNIVHVLNEKQGIFVIVNEFKHQQTAENQ